MLNFALLALLSLSPPTKEPFYSREVLPYLAARVSARGHQK